MRRVEDGKNKNPKYHCFYLWNIKKPHRHQTGIFCFHRQARGVVTDITTQDDGTIARILMTWA